MHIELGILTRPAVHALLPTFAADAVGAPLACRCGASGCPGAL